MLTARPDGSHVGSSKQRPLVTELVVRLNNEDRRIEVPDELSLIAFRNDMQFAYLFENFVWSSYGTPWLEMAALGRIDDLSTSSCQAFAQTVYGKHHHLEDVEMMGSLHYGKTVRNLSTALSHAGERGSENLIVPIMVLLLHAVITVPSQIGQASFWSLILF
jgi:hypothetical protein